MAERISKGMRTVHRDMTMKIADLSTVELIEAIEKLVGDKLRRRKGDLTAPLCIEGRPINRVSDIKLRVTLAALETRLFRSEKAGESNFGQLLPVYR